jgi:hypothetical protein
MDVGLARIERGVGSVRADVDGCNDRADDAWTDHILRLPDDPGREVGVALMLSHIPK